MSTPIYWQAQRIVGDLAELPDPNAGGLRPGDEFFARDVGVWLKAVAIGGLPADATLLAWQAQGSASPDAEPLTVYRSPAGDDAASGLTPATAVVSLAAAVERLQHAVGRMRIVAAPGDYPPDDALIQVPGGATDDVEHVGAFEEVEPFTTAAPAPADDQIQGPAAPAGQWRRLFVELVDVPGAPQLNGTVYKIENNDGAGLITVAVGFGAALPAGTSARVVQPAVRLTFDGLNVQAASANLSFSACDVHATAVARLADGIVSFFQCTLALDGLAGFDPRWARFYAVQSDVTGVGVFPVASFLGSLNEAIPGDVLLDSCTVSGLAVLGNQSQVGFEGCDVEGQFIALVDNGSTLREAGCAVRGGLPGAAPVVLRNGATGEINASSHDDFAGFGLVVGPGCACECGPYQSTDPPFPFVPGGLTGVGAVGSTAGVYLDGCQYRENFAAGNNTTITSAAGVDVILGTAGPVTHGDIGTSGLAGLVDAASLTRALPVG